MTHRNRVCRRAAVALAGAVLITGCGAGTSRTASTAAPSPPGSTAAGTTSTVSATAIPAPLAFSRCMRAHGIPNFPDPEPGRGLLFNTDGMNPGSPAMLSAQAACRELLPGGGPPGPGTHTDPSAQTLAKLLRIARCLRAHGISRFPDPRTSVPSDVNPNDIQQITDFDGAILLIPASIDLQAPAYRQALTACGAPPLGLPH